MTVATVAPTSEVIGTRITSPDGEALGKIDELVLDFEFDVIAYAVVSFGGFMGFGNKWFIVPWTAFTPSNSEDKFVLDIPVELFKETEGFDREDLPEIDRSWGQAIHEQYRQTPYWAKLENKQRVSAE